MKHFSDICIVGAGIGGLTCANELVESLRGRDLSIRVFDLQEEVGGRVRSSALAGRQPVELGAERYSPSHHATVQQVMQRYGRISVPYPFAVRQSEGSAQQAMQAALTELSAEDQQPFFSSLSHRFGCDAAHHMIRSLGYDALLLPVITTVMAYDIIGKHPEIQSLTGNGSNPWFCAEGGMQGLLLAMKAQAQAAGVAFSLRHRLLSVNASQQGYQLKLMDEEEQVLTYETRHLVLALPPSAMRLLNVDFPQGWSQAHYGSLPLFKGFLFYSHPWWLDFSLRDRVRIVDNPMRKVYFRGDRYVFFYNDSESASYWRSCLADGEKWYLATVRRYLAEALGLPETVVPEPCLHLNQYWPHGVEYYQSAGDDHPLALQHEQSGIVACSDAYTVHCGWMEGSLQSAGAASRLLLARLSI